jgi:hypothetical protein
LTVPSGPAYQIDGAAGIVYNNGYIAPGVEFTKVLDEANKRVGKVYIDVEIPFYYRVNAGVNDVGSKGQLIAPVLTKLIASYNF